MRSSMSRLLVILFFLLIPVTAQASCQSVLENNVGWTIVDSKTIDGYKDQGEPKADDFEGCDYDRIIYFRDGTTATCSSYGYQ